jgi:hypothetical protein
MESLESALVLFSGGQDPKGFARWRTAVAG